MIGYTSSRSNKFKQKMINLDTEIRGLERLINIDKSMQNKQKSLALKAEYEHLSTLKLKIEY